MQSIAEKLKDISRIVADIRTWTIHFAELAKTRHDQKTEIFYSQRFMRDAGLHDLQYKISEILPMVEDFEIVLIPSRYILSYAEKIDMYWKDTVSFCLENQEPNTSISMHTEPNGKSIALYYECTPNQYSEMVQKMNNRWEAPASNFKIILDNNPKCVS